MIYLKIKNYVVSWSIGQVVRLSISDFKYVIIDAVLLGERYTLKVKGRLFFGKNKNIET